MQLTILLLPPENEYQRSFNCFRGASLCCTAMNSATSFRNAAFNCQSFQYVLACSFTNMHAVSLSSGCILAHSSRVTSKESTFYIPITYLLTVSQVKLDSVQSPSAMSNSKSLSTLLLEVMISSMNEPVFIRYLPDLTVQIIFDAWWASIDVGSKYLIVGIIVDLRLRGDSMCIAESRGLAFPASYVLFVIKFVAIHQNMGPAHRGNTCWQKHTLQSWMN